MVCTLRPVCSLDVILHVLCISVVVTLDFQVVIVKIDQNYSTHTQYRIIPYEEQFGEFVSCKYGM